MAVPVEYDLLLYSYRCLFAVFGRHLVRMFADGKADEANSAVESPDKYDGMGGQAYFGVLFPVWRGTDGSV